MEIKNEVKCPKCNHVFIPSNDIEVSGISIGDIIYDSSKPNGCTKPIRVTGMSADDKFFLGVFSGVLNGVDTQVAVQYAAKI